MNNEEFYELESLVHKLSRELQQKNETIQELEERIEEIEELRERILQAFDTITTGANKK